MSQTKPSLPARLILRLIRLYQAAASPLIGGRAACRFIPTCSEYTAQAVPQYGASRGMARGLRRIMRCRPGWCFGDDPVPLHPRSL